MKRIVYSIGDLNTAGGIGRIVSCKANWLASHNFEVTILTTEGHDVTPFYPLSEKVKTIALDINFLTVYKNKRNLIGMMSSFCDRMRKLKSYKKKVSQYLAEYPCDVFFTTANFRSILRLTDGSRKIYETHFSCESQRQFMKSLPPIFGFFYRLYNNVQNRYLEKYDTVVLLTERDRQLRGELKNARVIPNFITLQVPEDRIVDYQTKKAIAVGRLDAVKDFKTLLLAWEIVHGKHPEWTLDIYGQDSGELSTLTDTLRNTGLMDVVSIHPPVRNITDKYFQASFYVMTSKYEGFPLVLGEAMSCGLPCIAYDCNCGPSEIIRDKEDGLIVRPVGDVREMANAICWMIEHPKEREIMGKQACINIQRFAIDNVMFRWIQLINE